jgi:hypothetical protein
MYFAINGKFYYRGEIMSKLLIQLITCEDGDWEVLRMNLGEDFSYEGHGIPNEVWIRLLKKLGYNVEIIEISNDKMEMVIIK